jgi:hypothetical protein
MTDETISAEELEIAEAIAEDGEQSIWGQKSDIDFLAPATTKAEYEEMLAEDGENVDCEVDYEEDLAKLELE